MRSDALKTKIHNFFDLSHLTITENGKRISVFSLAFPTFLQYVLLAVIGTVNTAMISGYAEDAVGAIAAASQLITLASAMVAMIKVGTNVMVNISLGRGDKESAARYAGASMILSLIWGTLISITFAFFASDILEIMNIEGDALLYGKSYLQIYGGALVIQIVADSITSLLVCYGYTMYTMVKSICTTAIGVLSGYIFLNVDIIPYIDGTVALAIGNVVSFIFNIFISSLLIFRVAIPIRATINVRIVSNMLRVGIPGGMSTISYMIAQTITTSFMASIGMIALNTKSYVGTIVQYTYFVSAALSTGVQIMMGRYVGQKDEVKMRKLVRTALKIAVLSNGICSLLVCIAHKSLLTMFTDDPDVFAIASIIFVIDIAVEVIRAINHVMEPSLNATRDVYTTFTASVISCWGGSVFLSYLFGIRLGMGITGCWLAFAIDELVKASIYAIRWHSGKWKKKLGIDN